MFPVYRSDEQLLEQPYYYYYRHNSNTICSRCSNIQSSFYSVKCFNNTFNRAWGFGILDYVINIPSIAAEEHSWEDITKEQLEARLIEAPHSPLTIRYVNSVSRRKFGLSLLRLKELTGVRWYIHPYDNRKVVFPYGYLFSDLYTSLCFGNIRGVAISHLALLEEGLNVLIPERRVAPCEILPYSTRVDQYFIIPNNNTKIGKVLMGVELELEKITNNRLVKVHTALGNHCIFKHDGSLANGIEIVSKPATIQEHKQAFEQFFTIDHQLEASDRCGIHIHLDRRGLSFLQLGKIVEFMNREENTQFISKLARRSENTYWKINRGRNLSWFAEVRNYGGDFGSRYSVTNLNNEATVEFRMFRSTTDKEEFLSNLEFVDAIARFTTPGAHSISLKEQTKHEVFLEWMKGQKRQYPNLAKFIGA